MAQPQIKLYYKNVFADVIGDEHGITTNQFDDLAVLTSPLIARLNKQKEEEDSSTPYRKLPLRKDIRDDVKDMAADVKADCDTLVVLGIGGSALGNIALQTALNPFMYNIDDKQRSGPRLFVLDNVDPAQLASFFDWLEDGLGRTIFNVISKSGRTSETAAQLLYVRKLLTDKLGPDACKKQIIATTDEKAGTLRTIVQKEGYRSLIVPDRVGGRFSVLSAVGLFSAEMCGIDIDALLAGAADMDAKVSCENFKKNPAAINAAINFHFYTRGKKTSVMMPYSNALKDMADWYRQLWAESLGKSTDVKGNRIERIGPTPIRALGATDQHSQVQLYREGPNDKLFTFLKVKEFNGEIETGPAPRCTSDLDFLANIKMSTLLNNEKLATEYALLQDRRPCLTILFDKVDAYTVGQFICLFEVTTSFAGALFNINPYDQPAVELGKEATFALMHKPGEYKKGWTYRDFADEIRSRTDIDEEFLV
ncbi:MAG: glucose-6-phosphate isomerase [Sedimentisphaerales bacterium]|nr:glucose-6-phosphate isomerase [Sedimentisphaerales bacterium]